MQGLCAQLTGGSISLLYIYIYIYIYIYMQCSSMQGLCARLTGEDLYIWCSGIQGIYAQLTGKEFWHLQISHYSGKATQQGCQLHEHQCLCWWGGFRWSGGPRWGGWRLYGYHLGELTWSYFWPQGLGWLGGSPWWPSLVGMGVVLSPIPKTSGLSLL